MDVYRSGHLEASDKQAKVRLEAAPGLANLGPQTCFGFRSLFFFFKVYFLLTIFKVFIEFFIILLLGFYFNALVSLTVMVYGILAPQSGIEPTLLQ